MMRGWDSWDHSSWGRGCLGNLINVHKYLMGLKDNENRARLFSLVSSKRARDNLHKMKYRKFLKLLKYWNRLPTHVLEFPSLWTSKYYLKLDRTQLCLPALADPALSRGARPGDLHRCLPISTLQWGGLEWMASRGVFQPRLSLLFCELQIDWRSM